MSTSSGSGVGGSIGGPQQPSIFELEQRGIQDAIKQRYAIAKELDTMEFPMLLLSEDLLHRYRASPDRPVLAPLAQMRIKTAFEPAPDESSKIFYDDLVGRLPPELQAALSKDQSRPFEERNLNFTALNNLLQGLARTLVTLEKAAQPLPPESVEEARKIIAQRLPFVGFKSALGFSAELAKYMNGYLEQIGPNDPVFDTVKRALSNAEESATTLTTYYQQFIDGKLQGFPTADLAEAAAKIGTDNQIFQRDSNGDSFQILRHTMDGAALFAGALSLHEFAPLSFLSLYLGKIGNADDPGQGGIYSPAFDKLINQASTGLQALLNWNATTDSAKAKTLDTVLSTLALFATSGGAYLGKEGIGPFPPASQGDIVEAKRFSADLGLNLLTHSGIIDSVTTDLAKALEVKDKEVAPLASALSLWVLLLGIRGAETCGNCRADQLLESIQPHLLTHLKAFEQFVTQRQQAGLSDPASQGVGVYLNQAIIALEGHDYNGLADSLKSLSGLTGYPEDKTAGDLKSVASFGSSVQTAFSDKSRENSSSITGISQA